ncbi:MAG: RpiB/LacA/LacB family sugar-phosphate isomerase [Vicinamibacterales bacterium]|jgi:ribose 5-phosphate isomerase B|nr:RpiB/LacA/LacB family sugar-phosphate isomerase [Vicinamibacterales bacterium]
MQRFSLITEADARRLAPGAVVELEPGGHVTPLALDTLRSLGVRVVPAGTDEAEAAAASLAPPAEVRVVALGTDHSGLALKRTLAAWLRGRALRVVDCGTDTAEPVDYPDIAQRVATAVASGEAQAGIVIDGAGLGSAIAANKVRGIRAAMATTPTLARYARQHNGANVLALGATLVSEADARAIVDTFLQTPMTEPRYIKRLVKLKQLEDRF